MITVYHNDPEKKAAPWLSALALRTRADELRTAKTVVWIDLEGPDAAEEKLVFQEFFPIHPLTLEDVTKLHREPGVQPHLPKAEEFRDYLFVVANPLAPNFLDILQGKAPMPADGLPRVATQLSAVITSNLLITHHVDLLFSIEQVRTFLIKHGVQAERGPDYLFHLILDSIVDQYAPVLDYIDEALEEIEIKCFREPAQALLFRLLALKRQIIALRKTLVYEREVLARLARGEFELIDQREMVYYRNVYDHLVRFAELADASRDMASDLMQTHLAAVSNRLNEVMKVLTMISTVILPMALISGIYGMNFKHNVWPEFEESTWGFPGVLAAMLLMGSAALVFFRWRRWI